MAANRTGRCIATVYPQGQANGAPWFRGNPPSGICPSGSESKALQAAKKINGILEKTYPRVPYQQKTLQVGSKQIVAVIVIGSELRPHFAGPAYVRRGSESIDASQEQLDLLIAQRSSKLYRLAQNIDQPMTLNIKFNQGNRTFTVTKEAGTIQGCNESWVTVHRQSMNPPQLFSFPLATVEIGWDHQYRRIELFVEKDQPF